MGLRIGIILERIRLRRLIREQGAEKERRDGMGIRKRDLTGGGGREQESGM